MKVDNYSPTTHYESFMHCGLTSHLATYDVVVHSPKGAAVAEWLSSLLVEQEDRGSIPGLAT